MDQQGRNPDQQLHIGESRDRNPDYTSLYRRWVLQQISTVRMNAREAVDYCDTHTLSAGCTGLTRTLSQLDPDTMVIGVWTPEKEDGDWVTPYLNFYLESTMENLGIAFGPGRPFPPEVMVPDPQEVFARWALEQINQGHLE